MGAFRPRLNPERQVEGRLHSEAKREERWQLHDPLNDLDEIQDLAEKYSYSEKLEELLEHREKYLTNHDVIPSQLEFVSVRDRYRG